MPALYSTKARVVGGREGHVETEDGILKLDLAPPKELGGKGGATNPEQLFAAGYAACFESALRFAARRDKVSLTDATVTATIGLNKNAEGGFALSAALEAETKGLDQATAEKLAAEAHKICPYSNALRGNVDVAVSVKAL